MIMRSPLWRRLGCWLAMAGFICQTLMLAMGFHKALPGGLSLGAYLQMLAWFVLLCGLAVWFKLRQETALLFAAPLGLMLFAMSAPYLSALVQVPPSLKAPFYALAYRRAVPEPGTAGPRLCRRGAVSFSGGADQKQTEHEGFLAGYARPFHAG